MLCVSFSKIRSETVGFSVVSGILNSYLHTFLKHCRLSLSTFSTTCMKNLEHVSLVVFSVSVHSTEALTLSNTHTNACLSKHTLLSLYSPAAFPVYPGWSFPSNLMLGCSSPAGLSYANVCGLYLLRTIVNQSFIYDSNEIKLQPN